MTETTPTPVHVDLGDNEYFDFEVLGKSYRLRYPNVEETDLLRDSASDEIKSRELVCELVEPIDKDGKPFNEFVLTLRQNQWKKLFIQIIDKINE